MKKDGLANATINRKMSALSKLTKLAEDLEVIRKRPKITFLKEGKGRDRVLSRNEEVKALQFFDHIGLKNSGALFAFLLYTGARIGEAYEVKHEHVSGGRVMFKGPNERGLKNGDFRSVPLVGPAKEAWEHISRAGEAYDRPFQVIPIDTFRGHWERLRQHLGAEDDPCFVPHMLGHTCATRLVVKGVALPQVMKWMGHRNIQTTMKYAHLMPKDLDVAAMALLEAA